MKRRTFIAAVIATASVAGALQIGGTMPVLQENGLVVNWRERVSPGTSVNYSLRGNVEVTYGCFNRGGNNPAAANKRATWHESLRVSQPFLANQDGQVIGRLKLPMPSAAGHLSCPPGQAAMLSSATYSRVVLTNHTNGKSHAYNGSYSKTFRPLKK